MYIMRRYALVFFLLLLSLAAPLTLHAQERIIVKFKTDALTPESIDQKADAIKKKQNGNLLEKIQSQFMILQESQQLGDNPLTLQAELDAAENTARVKKQTQIFSTKSKFRSAAQQALLSPMRLVEISDAKNLDNALAAYNNLDTVEWAVYDAPVTLFSTPNDPRFSQQWSLYSSTDHDIDATDAWNITQGSAQVTLAEIDSGIDRNHPDLKDNIFVNTAEIPGNNIDDDGNGYIDDIYGWNFLQNNNDTFDTDSHGTHVAGIMAAKINNSIGVAGVSQSKILPLRIFTSGGVDEHTSDVLRALQYIADNAQRFNIKAVNMSFGAARARTDENATDVCVAYEPILRNLYTKGVTAVAAAGNGVSNKPWEPNQGVPFYNLAPAGCYGVIAVGATDTADNLASFSNYGLNMVLSAPGSSYPYMTSTCPKTYTYDDAYCEKIGTSMAAPHVVGTLGLMYAVNPNLNHWISRSIFTNPANYGVDDKIGNSTPDHYAGTGRLNAYKAVLAAQSASSASEPASMTIRDQDIGMSFSSTPYSSSPTIKVSVTDEATGKSVSGTQIVLSLTAPNGQIKQFSGFTETRDPADPSRWIATFTAYLSTNTPNALSGTYTVSLISVAGNTNRYRSSFTSKTFSSTGATPATTPTGTPIRTPTPSLPTVTNAPTPTRTPTPTVISTTNTPTPTASSGGTKTCYQVCSYSSECASSAPYCYRFTGSSFSYCSASPSTLTCTAPAPTNTPTRTPTTSLPTVTSTPTPTLSSGGTKTCYQVCSYSSECASSAPYCYRFTGSSFSYCSASPSTLTCTTTITPTPTSQAMSPTVTPTPPVGSSVCAQYLGASSSCRLPLDCAKLGGASIGISCGTNLYCCYGK